jgi:hypothetical protein
LGFTGLGLAEKLTIFGVTPTVTCAVASAVVPCAVSVYVVVVVGETSALEPVGGGTPWSSDTLSAPSTVQVSVVVSPNAIGFVFAVNDWITGLAPVVPLELEVVAPPEEPEDEVPVALPDELLALELPEELELELELLEEPVLEEPVLEEPVLEDPVLEEPVLEDPVLEEPVLDVPVLEVPELLAWVPELEPVEFVPVVVPPPSAGAFWKHALATESQCASAAQSALVLHGTTPLPHPASPTNTATQSPARRMHPPARGLT